MHLELSLRLEQQLTLATATAQIAYLVIVAASARLYCEACRRDTIWRYGTRQDNRKVDAHIEHVWKCNNCGTHVPFQPAFG